METGSRSVIRARLQTLVALGVLSALVLGEAPALARSSSSDLEVEVRKLEAASGAPVTTLVSPHNGRLTFFAAPRGGALQLAVSPADDPGTRARVFVELYGAAFGVMDVDQVRTVRQSTADAFGMEHVRLQQVHRGVPVTGGEIAVHLRGAAAVAATAKIVPGLENVETVPALGESEAEERILDALAQVLARDEVTISAPRLEILNRGLLEDRHGVSRLAWFAEARGPGLREFFWIDALDGAVLLHFSQLAHALDRRIYDAADGPTLPGAMVRDETTGASGDTDVDTAFAYLGDTWDYYWVEHGRDSFDGGGATIDASVDYCPSPLSCPYDNAFWNGSQMVFGDGMPAADDITAHELTHAVIESTADLFYYMQSGALSESYSDVFGELVDLANGGGADVPEVRWLLGEDLATGASRNMMDPTEFGDPAWMGDWRFVCDDPGDDGGGVHSNSGVPNHAFALAVDGGLFNGVTITGIGATKAGKVHYRALAHYLLSASNFTDNAAALRQSCQDLIGTAGILATDCVELAKALDAVGMDQPWCSHELGTAPVLCPAEEIVSTRFVDDLEEGTANWSAATATANPVGSNVWGYGHDFATSGDSHLWGDLRPQCDPDLVDYTDSSVEMVVDVAVPAGGGYLQFRHAFGFENYSEFEPHEFYDGGVLEYSVNGGSGWQDAGELISAGLGYSGTIDGDFGNPLGGRRGFVGDSWGYTRTQVDLAVLEGMNARFRFRIGTDDTTDFCDYGWFVDDVRVFECPTACLALPVSGCLDCSPALVLAGGGGLDRVEAYVGCDSITAGPDYGVGLAGYLRLIAPTIVLRDGFFVEHGGRLEISVE